MRVGIVAPSSKVADIEFEMGLQRIREAGLEPLVHPHTLKGHLFFAGTDEQRAQALWQMANDESVDAVWAARGGYGSARILPLLDNYLKKARGKKPRKKLLIGFSDSTALLEYVRIKWGWHALHAPMPGLRQFCALPQNEWGALIHAIRSGAQGANFPWESARLEFLGKGPARALEAPLIGGNLSVWASLVGTPYEPRARGKLVFFEDVDENLYRVDRMVQQLLSAGSLKGARGVILGNFLNCRDIVPRVLGSMPESPSQRDQWAKEPDPSKLVPLRQSMEPMEALDAIFGDVSRQLKIPIARGLPVGHGPGKAPLPLGATYALSPRGSLSLRSWGWRSSLNLLK